MSEPMNEGSAPPALSAVIRLDGCSVQVDSPERAQALRAVVDGLGDAGELAGVFSMLADPGRLRLLVALLAGGEVCVCDLAEVAGLSESATSHALRLLRTSRIVRVRRAGRMAYYRLEDDHVRRLLELALAHQQHTTPGPDQPPSSAAGRLPGDASSAGTGGAAGRGGMSAR